jgi:hypothetical protein
MKKKTDRGKKNITQEEVVKRLGSSAADKVWTVTSLALAFVEKYGDEGWEIVKKIGWERGVRKAIRTEKMMKEAGADFNDPREKRRYGREEIGFWGYVEHTDDNVVVKPDGKIRVEYRITRCPWVETWNEMGLSKELQLKLDTCLGVQSDLAHNKYFNVKYECDQGMPKGRDCCKFVLEKL